MNPVDHMLIAWLIVNLFDTDIWTRRFALVAGTISDIDGLPILFSSDLFKTYHHTLPHTLVFGIAVSAVLAALVKRKSLAFSIFILAFAAHLGADMIGSWGVRAFAPFISTSFSTGSFLSNDVAYGVVNRAVEIAAWSGAIAILAFKKRTPVEFLSRKFDRILADFLTLPFTAKCLICGKRAFFRCEVCSGTSCISHTAKRSKRIACVECERVIR